jgi:hypothetical protein
MNITRKLVGLLLVLITLGLVGLGSLALYRLAPHPAWCLCDVCHEQYDNKRGEEE